MFVLLMLVILANIFLPVFFKSKPIDTSEFEEFVLNFEKSQKVYRDSIEQQGLIQNDKLKYESKLTLFPFDPNNLPKSQWKKLGLSEQQIQVIKNYESKGGKFYTAEDLKKIYSISDEEYLTLRPFIRIKTEDKTEMPSKQILNPFIFDPNTVSEEELKEIGLQEYIISTFLNYRKNGGQFSNTEDIKKIYGITDDLYTQLEDYVHIAEDTAFIAKGTLERSGLIIEINSADTLDLQQLQGIGPSFARRIIKYRDLLGGYSCHEQLLEVYGMDSTRYANIKNHISIENKSIKKININKATIKDLIKHPYIEFYLAKSIITQREKIGSYSSLKDLMDASLIYDELFYKIEPYLTIDES
ncbi:MAG: helix-hairpin-helix domain-containing protein [Bacteroidales bacterium]